MPPGIKISVLLVPESVREWFRCRILRPWLRQLRGGVTPRRLAWSLALGVVVGINPSVGLTTLVVVMLAWAFGLNLTRSRRRLVHTWRLRSTWCCSCRSSSWVCICFTHADFRSTGSKSNI
jgi:hypothetical protein